jgi:hypothetical protein
VLTERYRVCTWRDNQQPGVLDQRTVGLADLAKAIIHHQASTTVFHP